MTRVICSKCSQFIMEEFKKYGSASDFWAAWSDGAGKRMGYQKITDTLKKQREERDEKDAAEAIAYFQMHPSEEADFMTYTRGNKKEEIKTTAGMAERWRARRNGE